jgi:hypothetical protein
MDGDPAEVAYAKDLVDVGAEIHGELRQQNQSHRSWLERAQDIRKAILAVAVAK